MAGGAAFEVFFDGGCPLCKREIRFLQKLDRRRNVTFTDIADPEFDAAAVGVSWEALMAEIHGRLPSGELVVGVEVFRQLYGAVGLGAIAAVMRLPGIAQLLDLGYRVFAKHRLALTGRACEGVCSSTQEAAN